MKVGFFKSLAFLATVIVAFSCSSAEKKAAALAEHEANLEMERQLRDSTLAAEREEKLKNATSDQKTQELMASLPDEPIFDIVTNMGTIRVKLYSKTPRHRMNFEKLALSGFYDSTLFHRVVNHFMIQGGDPYTRDTAQAIVEKYGQGGPGYTIPAEFVPEYTHKKGALVAARRGDIANPLKESSGSQFYLVQDEAVCKVFNGEETVFGETVKGLDVIDRIAKVATNAYDRPLLDVRVTKITPVTAE